MPIRPENRDRYPADWPEIRARIQRRAGNKCEKCRVPNHLLGGRDVDGTFIPAMPLGEKNLRLEWPTPGTWAWCQEPLTQRHVQLRIIRIVCTTAHFDHNPENCDDGNLRFWCQRCHLAHDRQQHNETAYRTRREGKAVGDLLEDGGG